MPAERVRALTRWGLFGLLLWSPLPFGSVGPTSLLVLELWALVLGALACVVLFLEPSGLGRRGRLALGLTAGLAGVGLLQLLPLGRTWASIWSPRFDPVRESMERLVPEAGAALSVSLVPEAGLDALMRLFAYVWVGLAAAVSLRRGEHLRQLAVVVGVAGAFQALYGSFEYLSGREHIFGYAKEHYLGEATGTFINRNHFAGYLAMALPLTLALIALPRRAAQWPGWRERLLTWADRRTLVRVSAFLAAFCIWTGVVLSYSRAGLVAALLGAGLMTALQWRRRWAVWLLVLALAAPTVVLLYRDLRAPGARLASLAVDVAADTGRIPVWGATAAMARDHFGLGTGFGTFDSAFPLYRPPTIHARWQHAHNDWLQSAAEGGLITTLLLAALLVVVLWPAAATGRARALLLAAAAGIAAIAFHSLSDFPLRIPAVAVLLAALAGARCATLEPPPAGPLREVTS